MKLPGAAQPIEPTPLFDAGVNTDDTHRPSRSKAQDKGKGKAIDPPPPGLAQDSTMRDKVPPPDLGAWDVDSIPSPPKRF
jgi:hypothetical protein